MPKKKQKLNWNTDTRNRTWAVRVRARYHSPYTIAEILEILLIIILNHMAYSWIIFFFHMFFFL